MGPLSGGPFFSTLTRVCRSWTRSSYPFPPDLENWISEARLPDGEGAEIDARLPVPDSLPAIQNLRWDRAGNLWVGRRVADPNGTEDFDVFDSRGRWISTVHFPKDMGYIAEIGDDYLLARWYDDLGVPYLRVFDLEKPRSGF